MIHASLDRLTGKNVLVRVDFNVPVDDHGKVLDDFRIKAALPTIKQLLSQDCSLALIAHLGRPEPGQLKANESLQFIANHLSELLAEKVEFRTDITDSSSSQQRVILYENLRNWPGEKAADPEFAKILARLGDVFVQEAFGNAHRADASMVKIAELLPSQAGLLLEKEVNTITEAMKHPKHPMAAIVGGAKIVGKIELIDELTQKAETLVIGGAMANTFLQDPHFGGFEIGSSIFEEGEEATLKSLARDFKKTKTNLILPTGDVAVGVAVDDTDRREVATDHVGLNDLILDFGSRSIEAAKQALKSAKTIIWNGPLGFIENEKFAVGSIEVATFLSTLDAEVIIGGGDTAEFIHKAGLAHTFSHVSTGGGASLELMSGKKLPAVEVLS